METLESKIEETRANLESTSSLQQELDSKRRSIILKHQRVIQKGLQDSAQNKVIEGKTSIALVGSTQHATNDMQQLEELSLESKRLSAACESMKHEIDSKLELTSKAAEQMEKLKLVVEYIHMNDHSLNTILTATHTHSIKP